MRIKTSILTILFVILISFITLMPNLNAQDIPGITATTNTEQINEDNKKVDETKKPTYHKIPVKIDNRVILYIGDTSLISAQQRSLDIVYRINKAIITAVEKKEMPIRIGIIEKGDNYFIEIANIKVIEITNMDTIVNNIDKEKLAQVWKSNIVDLFKNTEYVKNTTREGNFLFKLGSSFAILLIFIFIIGFIRVQLSKLIALFTKNLFYSMQTILNRMKHKHYSKSEENIEENVKDPQTLDSVGEQETAVEAEKIQEETIKDVLTTEDKQKIREKVDLLSKEINTILTVFSSIIVFFAVIGYVNYVLYLLPGTNGAVANFTHMLLSIFLVLKEGILNWLLADTTWEAFGRIFLLITITTIFIYVIQVIGTALENIIQIILEKDKARVKRIQTITKIIRTTLNILIVILAIVLILSELGVNIAPFIAGAGIIGLAISFGSQSLVKDIINGIFILIENQFGIGDVVNINDIGGVVEDMTLRVTILRDLSGKAYVIPNGQITTVVVFTKGWARAHLNIGIAYKEDIDTATTIIMEVAQGMKKEFPQKMIDEPEILGVDALNNSSVDIKIIMKTAPGDQWFIEREYRRRIKYAFDKHNIEIPFPHTTLYVPQPIGYEAKAKIEAEKET